MPNINTHWLVAMKCIKASGLPKSIVKGFEKYKTLTHDFKNTLKVEIESIIRGDIGVR